MDPVSNKLALHPSQSKPEAASGVSGKLVSGGELGAGNSSTTQKFRMRNKALGEPVVSARERPIPSNAAGIDGLPA